jgi:predicted RNase H-like nuclease (RuvC/YqgF family)
MPGREKWSCEKCKTDRIRRLKKDLQNAPRQIDDLKTRNMELEEKLLLVGTGRKVPVPAKQTRTKCMVSG